MNVRVTHTNAMCVVTDPIPMGLTATMFFLFSFFLEKKTTYTFY